MITTKPKSDQKELQELSKIPILENELMWICRVTDEEQLKQLPDKDQSESPI
jgi:hypothetical protein